MPDQQHCVWIVWGEESTVRESGSDMVSEYRFDTLAELNAFLMGIDAASGWMSFEQCDTLEEAEDYVRGICDGNLHVDDIPTEEAETNG